MGYSTLLRIIGNILILDIPQESTTSCGIFNNHVFCRKCFIPLNKYCIHKGSNIYVALGFELFATLVLFFLLKIPYPTYYLYSYFFFFSALLITFYTDMRYMLISRFVTLALIPLAVLLSYLGYIPLSPYASIVGMLSGFGVLFGIAFLFKYFTKKDGLGQGDIELIACIGAFTGFLGWWLTLLIGSFIASIYGILFMILTKQRTSVKFPFGPFLVVGALIFVLSQKTIIELLFTFLRS